MLAFRRSNYKGLYIALEGIDGSGKSSQTEAVTAYLQKKGKEVVVTREPRKDSGELQKVISDVLVGKIKLPPLAIQYLFTADRIVNQEQIVIPALKAGKTVIADRSLWSIIPYSLADLKLDLNPQTAEFMLVGQGVLSAYHQTIVPDQVFFLDISVDKAMERLSLKSSRKEIYEKRARVVSHYRAYRWLLAQYPKEFVIIDAEKKFAAVTENIVKSIKAI